MGQSGELLQKYTLNLSYNANIDIIFLQPVFFLSISSWRRTDKAFRFFTFCYLYSVAPAYLYLLKVRKFTESTLKTVA